MYKHSRLLLSAALILFLAVCFISARLVSTAQPAIDFDQPLDTVQTTAQPGSESSTNPVQPASQSTTIQVARSTQVPTCTKGKLVQPAALNLNNANGLVQVIDPPSYYQVYGLTPGQIQAQMHQCTPVAVGGQRYAASTNYNISWKYNYNPVADNKCAVTSSAVGLHINLVYPSWTAAGASTPTQQSWQAFITNLRNHEQGHVSLNVERAQIIATALQTFPPTDCSVIASQIDSMVNQHLATLNQFNAHYDAQTNHGATQGASLR